jgi:hypothetical protein
LLALLEREPVLPPLVTASAGNHGAALSSVARELGARLTIYVPRDAPHAKLDRLRGDGITIVADCEDYDDAEARAVAAGVAGDGLFISAYNHPDVIAGAGTIALEGQTAGYSGSFEATLTPNAPPVCSDPALAAKISKPTKDPWGGVRVGLEAKTKLNRKDYGINPRAAVPFGLIGNKEEMPVHFELLAVPR